MPQLLFLDIKSRETYSLNVAAQRGLVEDWQRLKKDKHGTRRVTPATDQQLHFNTSGTSSLTKGRVDDRPKPKNHGKQ